MSEQHFNTNTPLIPFQFESLPVTVAKDENGNPWWVLKEVCDILSIANASQAGAQLRPHETTIISKTYMNRTVPLLLVNESGLYRVIMRSNKPEAERFQDWVFGEVLPQIRKTGEYASKTKTKTKALRTPKATHPCTATT